MNAALFCPILKTSIFTIPGFAENSRRLLPEIQIILNICY